MKKVYGFKLDETTYIKLLELKSKLTIESSKNVQWDELFVELIENEKK